MEGSWCRWDGAKTTVFSRYPFCIINMVVQGYNGELTCRPAPALGGGLSQEGSEMHLQESHGESP